VAIEDAGIGLLGFEGNVHGLGPRSR